jgi:hypothetical protein
MWTRLGAQAESEEREKHADEEHAHSDHNDYKGLVIRRQSSI